MRELVAPAECAGPDIFEGASLKENIAELPGGGKDNPPMPGRASGRGSRPSDTLPQTQESNRDDRDDKAGHIEPESAQAKR